MSDVFIGIRELPQLPSPGLSISVNPLIGRERVERIG
jgi:hypothetical protein